MERRTGRRKVSYAHPLLEPDLPRTLGVPLFQEQLLRIAMVIANFTGGEAEELRRALGSRRSQEKMRTLELRPIAYASAWLKFHYLPVFTAATLNNQPMGFLQRRRSCEGRPTPWASHQPVDVTRSAWNCTLERGELGSYSLRLGLRYVHGLRAIAAAQLEQARALQPFSTIEELAHRVP